MDIRFYQWSKKSVKIEFSVPRLPEVSHAVKLHERWNNMNLDTRKFSEDSNLDIESSALLYGAFKGRFGRTCTKINQPATLVKYCSE